MSRERRVDFKRFSASSRLFGSFSIPSRRGKGASQLPDSLFVSECFMIWTNFLSSTDVPGLLSSLVRTKTSSPSPSSDLLLKFPSFRSSMDSAVGWCLTYKRLLQGSRREGLPLSRTCVLKHEASLGLWAPSKHAFPKTTHPRSRR